MSPTQKEALMTGLDGKATGFINTDDITTNTMQLLEMGFRPEILAGQFSAIDKLERGSNGEMDIFGAVSRFKNMGFNYLGASQMYDLMQRSGSINKDTGEWEWEKGYSQESVAKEIEGFRADPKNLSDSERLTTAINKMTDGLVNIGSFNFEDELRILKATSVDVNAILKSLTGEKTPDPMPGISEEVMREYGNRSEGDVGRNTILQYNGMPTDTTGMDEYRNIQERYAQIVEGVDSGILSQTNNSVLAEYLIKAVADGEFSTKGSRNIFGMNIRSEKEEAEDMLRELVNGINTAVSVMQAHTTRERDTNVSVTYNASSFETFDD